MPNTLNIGGKVYGVGAEKSAPISVRNPYTIDSDGHRLCNLFLEVTQRCNAFCDHCGSRCDSKKREELSAEDFKAVLDLVARKLGTKGIMLNVTGGEPLMRKDLFEIVEHAANIGFSWGLVTNGMLITDDIIEKFKETNMKTITISLDGMKETHEHFRHVEGCFDRIIEVIQKLKEANFVEHIQVTFVATKNNLKELPDLYRLLTMLGIDSLRVSNIDPIGRACDNENLLLEREDYEYLFEFIQRHSNSSLPVIWSCTHYFGNTNDTLDPTGRKFACFTGIHTASILYNGDIFGCPNIPRRPELIQGNILKDDFVDVWENKFQIYRNPERTRGKECEDCENWRFCRGDSFHNFDFDKMEPKYCFKRMFEEKSSVKDEERMVPTEKALIEKIREKQECSSKFEVIPKAGFSTIVIFTPKAVCELKNIFHYGECHPTNLYEQQVALIGNKIGNFYIVKFVVPAVLINRASNMAVTNDFCFNLALDEVDIINENIAKSDLIYQDDFGKVCLLGLAHSHPKGTEFRFSMNDTKNHKEYCDKMKSFITVLVNPQEELLVCFEGKECTQAKVILLH